jgi:hypothetical protein
VVEAEDPFGNVDPNFSGVVTASLSQGGAAAPLGGTLQEAASGGVARFDLSVINPGTGYTMQATSGTLTAGSSAPFDVALDRLQVTAQPPARVAAGAPISLTITATDAFGNPDPTFGGNVTIGMNFAGAPAKLGGILTATASGGVAVFSGLTLDQPGTYSLIISGPGGATVTTSLFTVTSVPAGLSVTSPPPALVTTHAPFGLTVAVEGANGRVDTTFNGPMTVTLASNPG